MKKKITIFALIAVCLSLLAYGTTAYFTYEDKATNVIVAGNIKIELQVLSVPAGGGDPVENDDAIDVLPGYAVSKIVQVKNKGSNAAWIRLSVDKVLALAEGIAGEADVSLVSYNLNTEYWKEKDGFYYYKDMLNPGETTKPLFTEVLFSPKMGDMYQQSKATINVIAYATQVANNGTDVFSAAGWPSAN
jgi:predicted ribosomally synthesized peptide with SipW-like signal peptide